MREHRFWWLLPLMLVTILAAGPSVAQQAPIQAPGLLRDLSNLSVDAAINVLKDKGTSAATLGTEKILNSTVTGSAAGYTLGNGWAYENNELAWTVGPTPGDLSYPVDITAGKTYRIKFDYRNSDEWAFPQTTFPASLTVSLGSVQGASFATRRGGTAETRSNQQELITAAETGASTVRFTASQLGGNTGGKIIIDNISVQEITPITAGTPIETSAGGTGGITLWSGGPNFDNVPLGRSSLLFNINGFQNSAEGPLNLKNNTSGTENTAGGARALEFNTSGFGNTGIGKQALQNNRTGNENVAIGKNSMIANYTGSENTAIGVSSLQANRYGWSHTALGNGAMAKTATGNGCTTAGTNPFWHATHCRHSVGIGYWAGARANLSSPSLLTIDDSVLIGAFVAPNLTSANRALIIGTGSHVNPVGARTNYMNLENIIITAGTDVPATSTTQISGNMTLGGTLGTVAGTGLTAVENLTINGPESGSSTLTLAASTSTGLDARLDLTPRIAGGGRGLLRTLNASDLVILTNDNYENARAVTNNGFRTRSPVLSKTANHQVTTFEYGTSFDNTGASGVIRYSLPAGATNGMGQCYFGSAPQPIEVVAPAGQVVVAGSIASADSGGLRSSSANPAICVELHNNKWMAKSMIGTWAPILVASGPLLWDDGQQLLWDDGTPIHGL
ncbi:MAG: hypothetical protein AB7H90_01480 [Alphaproteobacteria bacterium]